jgi:hypothetical protein
MGAKWFATGGIFKVKVPEMCFVILEAGVKGQRKYVNLMENRIKWKEEDEANEAVTVFQGRVMKRGFFTFRKYVFDVGTQCRGFCEKYGNVAAFDAAARHFAV